MSSPFPPVAKLGILRMPRLVSLFGTHAIAGELDGRPFSAEIWCKAGDHVFTELGRVKIIEGESFLLSP